MTDDFDLDRLYEWAMNSPRKRLLELLIVLAFLFYPVQFWLAEQIIRRRRGR